MPSGVLVIDKARGPTSHDVVARVRRALRTREVGHAGTLDPMATGVLVVAIGEATKLVPFLTSEAKEYVTQVALGVETDTLDADGRETDRRPVQGALARALSADLATAREAIEPALRLERERTAQTPPAHSAVHVGGERAYARARRGEPVDLPPREVRVESLDLLGATGGPRPTLTLRLRVSKGYYVRALARDLAAALQTLGHLTDLRRTRSGAFLVEDGVSVDAPPEALIERIVPLAIAAGRVLPCARLTAEGADHARHGRRVPPTALDPAGAGPHAWLDPDGCLVAIGRIDDEGAGRVLRGFGAPDHLRQ